MAIPLIALKVMLIQKFGPGAEADGLSGEFMEGLADKLGTGAAETDAAAVAAAYQHGCDSAEALEIGGTEPLIAMRSKGGDPARHEGGPGAGQRLEDRRIGVIGSHGGNTFVTGRDLRLHDIELG